MVGKPPEARQQHCPLSEPSPTQSLRALMRVAPPWQLPKALAYTIYRCIFYNRPYYQDRESKHIYLIHRNKYWEAAKMRRQRNVAPMKEQNKTSEKELKKWR